MKRKIKIIIVIILILISGLILFCIFNHHNKEEKKSNEKNQNIIENNIIPKDFIVKFAEDNELNTEEITKYNINEKYSNYYNRQNHKTVIIENKTNNEVRIEEVLKDNQEDNFNNLVTEQLNVKYPLFISGEAAKNEIDREYYFDSDGMTIIFKDVITNPIYEKEVSIVLTCNMINGIVDSNCSIDTDENPNIQKLDPSKKTVALTFDDGPNNNTRRVLQILSDNKTTATFFMLGTNMYNFPNVVKEVAKTNNEIASHTYSHKFLTKLQIPEVKNEINKPKEILGKLVENKTINLTRPPYGSINTKVKEVINTPIILWSVDPQDWRFRNGEVVKENILNEISDGDIILLHDIHSTTADALELLLPELYIEGYQVVSVSELAALKQVKLENGTIYRKFK